MNVLIVDDNQVNRKLLRVTLCGAGHRTEEAADGVAALEMLAAGGFDAVITDVLMPRMDGYRLAYRIRQTQAIQDIRIIIYSSTYTSTTDEETALKVGADAFLRKPSSPDEILAALARAPGDRQRRKRALEPAAELESLKEYSEGLVLRLEAANRELEDARSGLAAAYGALQESERKNRELFDSAPIGIYRSTREGRFASANLALARMLGYDSPEDLLALDTMRDLYYEPADREPILSEIASLGGVGTFEVRWKRRDGTPLWVRLHSRLVGEEPGGLSCETFVDDIDQRKRAQAALRSSEERFRQAFSASPAAMSLSDAKSGRLLDVNEKFGRVLGYSRDELIGQNAFELGLWVDPEDRRQIASEMKSGRRIRERETRLRTKMGEIRHIVGSIEPLGSGEETVMLSVFRDVTDRKRAEEKLRISEERYRLLFEQNPFPMWVYDKETLGFLAVNEAACRHYGYSHAEFLSMTIKDIRSADEVPPLLRRIGGEAGGSPRSGVWSHRKKDGTVIPVELTSNPFVFGGRDARLVLVNDVTDRLRAQEGMRKSEERFRKLFDSNTIGIVIADLNGRTLEANDAYLDMLGYTREELLAGSIRWDEITPPEHYAGDEAAVAQLQRTGAATPWEKELFRKDGSRVPVLIGVAMLGASEGSVIAYIVDLSERKRAEESIRQLLHAVEQAENVILLTDPAGHITYANPSFEALYGYTKEEALGRTPRILKSGKHDAAFYAEFWNRLRSGEGVRGEMINKTRDGRLVTVEMSANPTLDSDGKMTGFVAVQHDVTERRLLEQQFRQAQKMEAVGQLAGGVAHDFNNLLTAILGYSDLLAEKLKDRPREAEDVEEIRKAGERAASLTRQLLAFSRQQVFERRVLDVNSLVRDLEKMLRRLIGEDIELVTVTDPDLATVSADAGQLEQVVLNLAINARDAMPRGGKLTIETSNARLDEAYARVHTSVRPGQYVLISVSDTGVGMDLETRTRIFEPFFTTKERGKGTGLGLATVYGIVKQSGGYIWVYSEPGRGATFKVYLPPAGKDLSAEEPKRETRSLRGSETVLLVEDEESVRTLTRAILEAHGYEVLEAESADRAIEIAGGRDSEIQLLLTDVVMPGMGGPELASRIEALRPGIRVLYMSGYTDDSVFRHGHLKAGSLFLQKPFTPGSLARRLRDVLEG